MNTLEGITTGTYFVKTASGASLFINLDEMRVLRVPGDALVQFENDGEWMENVKFSLPVEVGKQIGFKCDPPMGWYRSTPVVSISLQRLDSVDKQG